MAKSTNTKPADDKKPATTQGGAKPADGTTPATGADSSPASTKPGQAAPPSPPSPGPTGSADTSDATDAEQLIAPPPQGEAPTAVAAKAAADREAAARAAASKSADTPADETSMVVQVVGPEKGFRRAGRLFGRTPVVIRVADLGHGDLDAILTEPKLVALVRPAAPGE
ncbi:hypothetical protein ACXN5S_12540 [Pseudoroseicyclus sp. H15]